MTNDEKFEAIKKDILDTCVKWTIKPLPIIERAPKCCKTDVVLSQSIKIKPVDFTKIEDHSKLLLGYYIVQLCSIEPNFVAELIADML